MADTESVVTGTDAAEDTPTGRAAVAVGEAAGGTAPESVAAEGSSSPSAVAAAKAKPRRSRKRVATEEPAAAAPDEAAETAADAQAKPRRTRKATADAEVPAPAPAKRAKRAPRKTAAAEVPGEPKPARRTSKAKAAAEVAPTSAPATDGTPEPGESTPRTGRRTGTRTPSKRKVAEGAAAEAAAAEGGTPAADRLGDARPTTDVSAGGVLPDDGTSASEPVEPAGATTSHPAVEAVESTAAVAEAETEAHAAGGGDGAVLAPTGASADATIGGSAGHAVETTEARSDFRAGDGGRDAVDERVVDDPPSGDALGVGIEAPGESTDLASAEGVASPTGSALTAVGGLGVASDGLTAEQVEAAGAAEGDRGSDVADEPAAANPSDGALGVGVDVKGEAADPAPDDGVDSPTAVAELAAHETDAADDLWRTGTAEGGEDAGVPDRGLAAPNPPDHDADPGLFATDPPAADDSASSDAAVARSAPDAPEHPDPVPAAADHDTLDDLLVGIGSDDAAAPAAPAHDPVDDLGALLPLLDERVPVPALRLDPTAPRRTLPRILLTAEAPLEPGSTPLEHSRDLAERGNYVLLAVPAEAAEVSTSVTAAGDGVLRVVNVPVDPETAADISVARADVAALDGGGFVTGIRRKLARRRLTQVRQGVWSAAAADPGWADRCADAYAPYRDAFAPAAEARVADALTVEADPVTLTGTRLAVGPTNTAGQGREWARAVRTHIPGVGTETFALSSGNSFGYDADHAISTDDWLSRTWQLRQLAYVLDNFSHVLAECAMPPFGRLNGPWANFDLAELDAAGIALAFAFHGSEIRDPAAQRERVPFSPFDPDHELTRALQSKVDRLGPVVRDLDVPKFVSTPDLLHDVPDAQWLPVVVDPAVWASDRVPLERDRPVVVHAPSSPFTKGTALIEPIVEELHDAGLIEYRRLKGVSHADMPALLADADIVLDQFVFGAYGVMSVQSLAAGRVTLCYLHESVTQYLPDGVPIVNADPDTLRDELERVVAERDTARTIAARGPAYVREHHDGARSAEVLAPFLGAARGAGQ